MEDPAVQPEGHLPARARPTPTPATWKYDEFIHIHGFLEAHGDVRARNSENHMYAAIHTVRADDRGQEDRLVLPGRIERTESRGIATQRDSARVNVRDAFTL